MLLQVADVGVREVTVERRDPDGRTAKVRAAMPLRLASGGTGIAYDHEMHYEVPVTYSVPELGLSASPVVVSPGRPYLLDPGMPALAFRLEMSQVARGTLDARSRQESASHLEVLFRRTPVVQAQGPRKAPSSRLVLRTTTAAQAADVEALLDPGVTLLLNVPPSAGWPVTHEYISVLGVDDGLTGGVLTSAGRLWTLPFRTVDPPDGPLRAEFTYEAAGQLHATYGAAAAAYPTYAAAARDERTLVAP